ERGAPTGHGRPRPPVRREAGRAPEARRDHPARSPPGGRRRCGFGGGAAARPRHRERAAETAPPSAGTGGGRRRRVVVEAAARLPPEIAALDPLLELCRRPGLRVAGRLVDLEPGVVADVE